MSAANMAQSEAVAAFKQVDPIESQAQRRVTYRSQSGQDSQSGVYPRIAGKATGQLESQLTAFGDGTRQHASMTARQPLTKATSFYRPVRERNATTASIRALTFRG